MNKLILVQAPCWNIDSPPYNIALLKAVCEEKGFPVVCLDFNITFYELLREQGHVSLYSNLTNWYNDEYVLLIVQNYSDFIDDCVNKILSYRAKLIGFSVTGLNKIFSLEIAKRIALVDETKKIIFGGPHCFKTEEGINFLVKYNYVDIVCLMEGELVILDLLEAFRNKLSLRKISGIGFRSNDGSIVETGERELLNDLSVFPFADFTDFELHKYRLAQLPISTSRGCINKCLFCSESRIWQKYRFRSAKNIFDEMKYQINKHTKVESFFLNDSLINGNIPMLDALAGLLIDTYVKERIKKVLLYIVKGVTYQQKKISWGGQAVIRKEMTELFLMKLKKAGLSHVSYGLETGSSRMLKMLGKGIDASMASDVIKNTKTCGINTYVNIVTGFPKETVTDRIETANFLKENKNYIDDILFHPLVITKGSSYYQQKEYWGIVLEDDFNSIRWHSTIEDNTLEQRLSAVQLYQQYIGGQGEKFNSSFDYYLYLGDKSFKDDNLQKAYICYEKAEKEVTDFFQEKIIKKKIRDIKVKQKKENIDIALVMCPSWGILQPPIGISYLKSFLSKYGLKVKCFDFNLELYKSFPEKKYWEMHCPEYFIEDKLFKKYICKDVMSFVDIWAENILKHMPRVVGFSLFASSINVSLLLALRLKKTRPDLIIVGGGAEVNRIKNVLTREDDELIFRDINEKVLECFDFLFDGEGEISLLNLFSCFGRNNDLCTIDGSFYLEKGQVVFNRRNDKIQDMNKLMPPDFSDFIMEEYVVRPLPIVTSRGCINQCTFCADSPLWHKYRCRSAEKVVEEFMFLVKKYGRNDFEIMDSTFNGDVNRVEEICDLMIKKDLALNWSAKVVFNKAMTLNVLKKMKKAGCYMLSYGVESGSAKVLNDMCKNINLENVKTIIKDTYAVGILINCFFIVGYPTETEVDFELTLDFIRHMAKYIHRFDQVTGCHIEENSYLGRNLDQYGIVFKEDGWYCQENTPNIRQQRLMRFQELVRDVHKHYQCEIQF